jgi:hypothetical protein
LKETVLLKELGTCSYVWTIVAKFICCCIKRFANNWPFVNPLIDSFRLSSLNGTKEMFSLLTSKRYVVRKVTPSVWRSFCIHFFYNHSAIKWLDSKYIYFIMHYYRYFVHQIASSSVETHKSLPIPWNWPLTTCFPFGVMSRKFTYSSMSTLSTSYRYCIFHLKLNFRVCWGCRWLCLFVKSLYGNSQMRTYTFKLDTNRNTFWFELETYNSTQNFTRVKVVCFYK